MSTAAPTPGELPRHQARRGRGAPTVTALVGPVGLGVGSWRGWAAADGRPSAVVTAVAPQPVLAGWVEAAFAAESPLSRACEWVTAASREGVGPREAGRMTRYDLDVLRRTLPVDPGGPGAAAAFLILNASAAAEALDAARFVRELSGGPDGWVGVVHGVAELYPPGRWPALLVVPPGDEGGDAAWGAAQALERIAAAKPGVPVAVALPSESYLRLLSRRGGTRPVALLREGFVELRGVSGNELEARLRRAGVDPPAATVARLAEKGVTEGAAEAYVRASHAVQNHSAADAESDFRSLHEGFLFGVLESMPETAGLFRPNHPPGFSHGGRAAEGDLVAESLRVAVEVDGGYYHLNPEQYRRDRRKDWLYQRHGYLVLRFLAEDVVADLESVLDTIREAVALRRAPAPPTGAE